MLFRRSVIPEAMVGNLYAVLLGKTLSGASRMRLENWMFNSTVTGTLLRAGVPGACV